MLDTIKIGYSRQVVNSFGQIEISKTIVLDYSLSMLRCSRTTREGKPTTITGPKG